MMATCKTCREDCDDAEVTNGVCRWCRRKNDYAKFAKLCGLTRFPDPTGERYVYRADDLRCDGKKSECVNFIDELWAALVKAKGGGKALLPE